MFTHRIQTTWNNGSASVAVATNYTADGETNRDPVIPADTDDVEVALAFTMAGLVSLFISSDVDVVIETNDGAAADDTLNISAGVPFVWTNDSGLANPFTADVTALFITNNDADADNDATVQIRCLHDATP